MVPEGDELTRVRLPAVLAACALLAAAAPAAARAAACDEPPPASGEWPSYGHDLSNSRTQPHGTAIGRANVAALRPAWIHSAEEAINNTPIVTGGCVFVASSDAVVTARDADDGSEVWTTRLPLDTPAFGGGLVGSPAVTADSVLAAVNERGRPYLAALDRATGALRWTTVIDDQPRSGINASVVVHDGLAFVGFFGAAGPESRERGGFALVDAATGEIVRKTFTIDDESFERGYYGAGIWSTAAIDTAAGFAYAGTSNPHSAQREHARANSLVKVDLRRASPTFGRIVAHYKGRRESYVEPPPPAPDADLAANPACEAKPDVYYAGQFSATCVQLDVDFGASPNLFRDAGGELRLGGLQKAGVYHAVDPGDMSPAWERVVGVPCFACNAASPAASGGHAYVAAGPPGQLFALDGRDGAPRWAGHLTGALTYNPVSVANGLVYTVDSGGFLDVFDAATGLQVAKRRLEADTGERMSAASTSSGVAIAHDTVFVAAARHVIALRR